jgi:Raf kinase inhibitor-like YbhB/YbcL family protein
VRLRAPICIALLALAGCSDDGGSGTELERAPTRAGFELASSDVTEGQSIDPRLTCDGAGASPDLQWKGVPKGTAQLALVLEDPDAPRDTFTHWLVYGIDPTVPGLPGAVPEGWTGYAPLEVREGENDFGNVGYGAPCPPGGEEHRYVFRLLALREPVDLDAGADRAAFEDAVAPQVLAEARLTAPYART